MDADVTTSLGAMSMFTGGQHQCDIDEVLDRVLGEDNSSAHGKRLDEVVSMLSPMIFPLPSREELDRVYRALPCFMFAEKYPEAKARICNFKVNPNWDVDFEVHVHDVTFKLDQPTIANCMHNVMRVALSAYLHTQWCPNQRPTLLN